MIGTNSGHETKAELMQERAEHEQSGLTSRVLESAANPFRLFADWFAEAERTEPSDPGAMALATVDAEGCPDVRMVLLRGFDEQGFVFYTNLESNKGRQLAHRPDAALCLHWKSIRRQIRVRGPVSAVTAEEADVYFASRHRLSRIGAWASRQSRPLESRFALEKSVAVQTARFGAGTIPRPDHWSGFRIAPRSMEFWSDGAFRLHDRVVFAPGADGGWTKTRLYP